MTKLYLALIEAPDGPVKDLVASSAIYLAEVGDPCRVVLPEAGRGGIPLWAAFYGVQRVAGEWLDRAPATGFWTDEHEAEYARWKSGRGTQD